MAVERVEDLSSVKGEIEALGGGVHVIMTTTHVDATYMSKR